MKVLATLLCLTALAFLAQGTFNEAVQQLARFQDPNTGAFLSNFNSAPSLEATNDALFLTSLYGLQNKINSFQVEQYLQSLRTKENGYASTSSGSPTIEATYNAIVSYVHLGKEVPQSSAVVDFILSLIDASGLFSNTASGRGSIKATYQAVATLRALDSLESLPNKASQSLKTLLSNAYTEAPVGKYFSFTGVPAVKSNFYGTYVWEALNEDVLEAEENFNFVLSQQSPRGGFFADTQRTSTTYESSALAMATLHILSEYSVSDYQSQVNGVNLANFCKDVPADLSQAAAAHKAIAHTSIFSENFKFIVDYGGSDTQGSVVLQGTQLRPELVVRSFNGPSHANLNVQVTYSSPSEQSKKVKMLWDEDNQSYVAPQVLDTSNQLGKMQFDFEMQVIVFGVAPIRFTQNSEKNIGYRVLITPTATNANTQASVNPGEVVSGNTNFEFDVKLANKTHSNIKSGEFDVTLKVLDSAYTSVYEEVVPADENVEPFSFEYALENLNVPAGELTFLVSVTSGGVAYSSDAVTYFVNVPMVASEIQINSEFTLGSSLRVTCVPANYPASGNLVLLAPEASGSLRERSFFLDIATPTGVLVDTIVGVKSPGSNSYSFSTTIPTSYDFLGSFVVSFRYETAKGVQVDLDNFDGEINEDPLEFEVEADLEATVLEQPTTTTFSYGNDVSFRVQVNDKVTGASVALGSRGGVFLKLNHFDKVKGKSFVSTKLPAVQSGEELLINWKVNPNAVQGEGTLVLVAEGPDGSELPLLVNGKQFSTDVQVGGEIKEDVSFFSTSDYYSSQTAFVVEFELSCNDISLQDVKLRANILYEGEQIKSVPVGVSGTKYLASWNSLHIESPSGNYEVQFYREADQQRASDNEEWRQKQLRAKQREAELSGDNFDAKKFLQSLESVEVEPLFSVSIPHKQVSRGGLPFGTEWLILLPVVLVFLYFDSIKRQYRRQERK